MQPFRSKIVSLIIKTLQGCQLSVEGNTLWQLPTFSPATTSSLPTAERKRSERPNSHQ